MSSKTWKRELGLLFAGILCYEIYIGDSKMVGIIVWPFVTFIAASAGIHTYGRVLEDGGSLSSNRGRSKRSSEHPSREDK